MWFSNVSLLLCAFVRLILCCDDSLPFSYCLLLFDNKFNASNSSALYIIVCIHYIQIYLYQFVYDIYIFASDKTKHERRINVDFILFDVFGLHRTTACSCRGDRFFFASIFVMFWIFPDFSFSAYCVYHKFSHISFTSSNLLFGEQERL